MIDALPEELQSQTTETQDQKSRMPGQKSQIAEQKSQIAEQKSLIQVYVGRVISVNSVTCTNAWP